MIYILVVHELGGVCLQVLLRMMQLPLFQQTSALPGHWCRHQSLSCIAQMALLAWLPPCVSSLHLAACIDAAACMPQGHLQSVVQLLLQSVVRAIGRTLACPSRWRRASCMQQMRCWGPSPLAGRYAGPTGLEHQQCSWLTWSSGHATRCMSSELEQLFEQLKHPCLTLLCILSSL